MDFDTNTKLNAKATIHDKENKDVKKNTRIDIFTILHQDGMFPDGKSQPTKTFATESLVNMFVTTTC